MKRTKEDKLMEISQITFDKSAFHLMADLLEVKKKKCYYCNKKITGKNVGGFFGKPIKLCCSNIVCLIQLANKKTQSVKV